MGKLSTNGLDEFRLSLEELADLSEDVMEDMLNAQADVIEPAQKEKARAYGVYRTGKMILSIKRGKIKKTKEGRAIYITAHGSRTRSGTTTREAEIAFINEFGRRGQPPRPFIRDANESHASEAAEAAAQVYDQHLKKLGL